MIDAILLALTAAVGPGATENPPPPAAVTQPASDAQRYCVADTPTGTRIAHRECHTRAEWLKQGFDPLAAK